MYSFNCLIKTDASLVKSSLSESHGETELLANLYGKIICIEDDANGMSPTETVPTPVDVFDIILGYREASELISFAEDMKKRALHAALETARYAAGASDALSTLKQPDPKELFIILSYYSNEDDGEFDRVGSCDKVYPTLEAAKAAADKLFKEDKENRPENIAVAYTLDDCVRDIEENPLYVVGEWQKNAFGSYHNFYAVFSVSLTED